MESSSKAIVVSKAFFIEKQESLLEDRVNKNGRPMELHIVAKNIAFCMNIEANFDLVENPPSCKLIYDFEDNEDKREVEALKSSPLEYTTHVDETGFKAVVEIKIGVLSSQHEGANFRVHFFVINPRNRQLLNEYSQPIKVISKRNQVRRILEKKQTKVESPTLAVPAKRSAANDSLMETLIRMEEQQKEQMNLLHKLIKPIPIPDPNDMDFETAFSNFVVAYTKIPETQRAAKLRRVLDRLPNENLDNLSEFIGVYSATAPNSSDSREEGMRNFNNSRHYSMDPNSPELQDGLQFSSPEKE